MKKSATIRFKRGIKEYLPKEGLEGEPIFCLDTFELYIGRGKGKPLKEAGIIDPDDFEAIHKYYTVLMSKKYFENADIDL